MNGWPLALPSPDSPAPPGPGLQNDPSGFSAATTIKWPYCFPNPGTKWPFWFYPDRWGKRFLRGRSSIICSRTDQKNKKAGGNWDSSSEARSAGPRISIRRPSAAKDSVPSHRSSGSKAVIFFRPFHDGHAVSWEVIGQAAVLGFLEGT